MSGHDAKRYRAMKGADAAAVSPLRYAPLQKIVNEHDIWEELECGHTLVARRDMIGRTNAARRRCLDCLVLICTGEGHAFVIDRGTQRSCPCGAGDGASMHLRFYHGIDDAPADLAEAEKQHAEAEPTREHYHWTGRPWEVRTRPEARR